jgi:phosphoglycolate phosphatase
LIGQHAVLFDGVAGMLAALDDAGTVWGIVTNKPEYLAR